jgi:hypothetical protein
MEVYSIVSYIAIIILIYYIITQEIYLTKIRSERNLYEDYLKKIVAAAPGTGGEQQIINEISNYFKNIEITEKATKKIEEFKNSKKKINLDAF